MSMHGQRGFTLLELLLSMALTAMLLGVLSTGVYTVVNDWQRENAGLDAELDQALVLLQIERALEAAYPHTYINRERLNRVVYFHGDARELRFVSTISPQRREGLTAWYLHSEPGQGVLLNLAPAFSDNPDERLEAQTPELLLPGYELDLRYLVQRSNDEKEWLDEWPEETMQSLPLAVHLTLLAEEPGQEEAVLEILAPIKANQHETIQPTIPLF